MVRHRTQTEGGGSLKKEKILSRERYTLHKVVGVCLCVCVCVSFVVVDVRAPLPQSLASIWGSTPSRSGRQSCCCSAPRRGRSASFQYSQCQCPPEGPMRATHSCLSSPCESLLLALLRHSPTRPSRSPFLSRWLRHTLSSHCPLICSHSRSPLQCALPFLFLLDDAPS